MRVVGVDVSKAWLDLALEAGKSKLYERQVNNDATGFQRLLSWVQERAGVAATQLTVVMEATGVYHEAVALALHEAGCRVIVANPKQVRDYAKGIGMLNKTDRADARALLRFGSRFQHQQTSDRNQQCTGDALHDAGADELQQVL